MENQKSPDEANPFSGLLAQPGGGEGESFSSMDTGPSASQPMSADADSGIENVEMDDRPATADVDVVAKLLSDVFRLPSDAPLVARAAELPSDQSSRNWRDAFTAFLHEVLLEMVVNQVGGNEGNSTHDSLNVSPMRTDGEFSLGSEPFLVVPYGNPFASEIQQAFARSKVEWSQLLYLLGCVERAASIGHSWEVDETQRQICTFVVLLSSGCLGAQDGSGSTGHLLLRAMVENVLPRGFLRQIMEVAENGGSFDQVFAPLLDILLRTALVVSIANESFRWPLDLLRTLVEVKTNGGTRPFCNLLQGHPHFLPAHSLTDAPGREVATVPILGRFFNISVFPDDNPRAAEHFFKDGDIPTESAHLQYSLVNQRVETVREQLHRTLHALLANSGSRERALAYLAAVIGRNADKSKMRVDKRTVASDGFLTNFASVMYRLTAKVQIEKVNLRYPFHEEARIDITEEARFRVTLEETKQFLLKCDRKGDRKFPTECLFLCIHAQHISVVPLIHHYNELRREEVRLREMLRENERALAAASSLLPQTVRERNRITIQRQRHFVKAITLRQYATESILCADAFLGQSVDFAMTTVGFLSRLADSAETAELFANYPTFYLEDTLDIVAFALQSTGLVSSRSGLIIEKAVSGIWIQADIIPFTYLSSASVHSPHLLNFASVEFVEGFLRFLCNPSLFTSPYVAARLVEVMFYSHQPAASGLNNALLNNEIAYQQLFMSLVTFYVDCEFMEASIEFGDKLSIRYHIQVIFKVMWNHPTHRSIMIQRYRECGMDFVKFINMLINDATYLLDQATDCLKSINEVQTLMDSPEFSSLSREDQEAKQELLHTSERNVKSYLQLAEKTLDLFQYMSEHVTEPFLSEQLGDRLAAMLNYNLAALCSKKAAELKVKNKEKYLFDPKKLLGQLIDIYLHLARDEPEKLYKCIAADERSYTPELFERVMHLVGKHAICTMSEIERFQILAAGVKEVWREAREAEDDLGDIPDEFCDPILGTLMKDPVQLPSGHIVDRRVIHRHLLSDPHNPFNRQDMTEADLQDLPELKNRIAEWVKSKRAAKK